MIKKCQKGWRKNYEIQKQACSNWICIITLCDVVWFHITHKQPLEYQPYHCGWYFKHFFHHWNIRTFVRNVVNTNRYNSHSG